MGLGSIEGVALGTAGAVVGVGVLAEGTEMIEHQVDNIVPNAKKKLKAKG